MFELFLENAGGKLRFIAKVVMGLTLFAALALLVASIFVLDDVALGMVGSITTFLSGWVSALVLQAIGDAADGGDSSGYTAPTAETKASAPVKGISRPDWYCTCGSLNPAASGACKTCGKLKMRICPNCSGILSVDATECPRCHTPW